MQLPSIRGVIDRRILVNFRVDADVLSKQLPPPFRPQLVNGVGIAGICLIRLIRVRPNGFPAWAGLSSENAAHRIAVAWENHGQQREGVYVPRRDTSSWLNTNLGGMIFPGEQHHAMFRVHEEDGRYQIGIESDDHLTHMRFEGHSVDELPVDSIFSSLADASTFFEQGSIGYSATRQSGKFDGLELQSFNWKLTPLAIDRVESSFFDDQSQFPDGSIKLDSAFLMQGINHEWHRREPIVCDDRSHLHT